jgi:glutamate---cysteine ligase / carboxylate-amine ligase
LNDQNPPEATSASALRAGPGLAAALRAAFDGAPPYTVGIEDELMLLDPDTFELAPRAAEVMQALREDERFKPELPASQLEIITPVCGSVPDAAAALLEARRALAARTSGLAELASAGVHPFSSGIGALNRLPQYEHTIDEFGAIARRQLVCALQVHVSIGDADRALAVYNAARSYLPWLAALAANAPFYEGRDSGLASVRPKLGQLLPRQGVPPPITSWEAYAETLRWGAAAGAFPDARAWWWELRLHRRFGTIEFRVPDGQSTVADAAALAAIAQALTAWLGQRHDTGERLPVAPSWRIDENRWSACRDGVQGTMADLQTGERRDTRAWLEELLEAVEPVASTLGGSMALEHAAALIRENGAIAQRAAADQVGIDGVARWLAERFLDPWPG